MLHFDDDAKAHDKTDALDWRESYYVNFFDTASDLYGLAWQGVRPNARAGEALFVLYDGDRELIRSVETRVAVAADVGPERTAIGNQRFECIEPWRRWRIHYADEASRVTVDWTQMSRICDWDWDYFAGAKHFQAAGRVEVSANVDGREIAFSGFGERDRAWGERNYDVLSFSWFQTVQFPDGDAAHVFAVESGKGTKPFLMGYLHHNGVTTSLRSFHATNIEYASAFGPPTAAELLFTDETGRELRVTKLQPLELIATVTEGGQVEDRVPDGSEDAACYLTFQRFVREDGAVGRGMIDLMAWTGNRLAEFHADEPTYSTIYEYGSA